MNRFTVREQLLAALYVVLMFGIGTLVAVIGVCLLEACR